MNIAKRVEAFYNQKHCNDLDEFILFEDILFYDFQHIRYDWYVAAVRFELIKYYDKNHVYINYLNHRKRNIAVYAGSFNPFHQGHYNILQKAERIFDKVIIARGINPEKSNELVELPNEIKDRQIMCYDGLLTDFIDSLGHEVTLIRGLRNSTDLQYELTQYRFLQDLKPNINVVSIFCDKGFEHISSSAIRMLKKYDKGDKYLI